MSFADRMAVVNEEESPIVKAARRVAALPVRGPLSAEEVEAISGEEVTSQAWREGFRFWEPQARTLLLAATEGGAHVPYRVGGGKSLCAFAALKVFARQGARRLVLHVPPRVYAQTMVKKIPQAWRALGMDLPIHGLGGGLPRERRQRLASSGWTGVYVLPFSLLSCEDADEMLDALDPDAVVVDEAHHLGFRHTSNSVRRSVRARRWEDMMRARDRRCVVLSGSMDIHSIRDSHHLMTLALRENSPLPLERTVLRQWAEVLDADTAKEPDPERVRALLPVLDWARHAIRSGRIDPALARGPLTPDAQGLRRAYRLRRDSAPGVVASTGEDDVGTSLIYRNLPADLPEFTDARACELEIAHPPLDPKAADRFFVPAVAFAHLPDGDRVNALIWAIDRRARTPAGDVIEHGFHGFKWKNEISAGIYNELTWPTVEKGMQARAIDQGTAADLLERSKKQYRAWQSYASELRYFLDGDRVPGLDTPELVGTEIKHHGDRRLPVDLVKKWQKAKGMIFDGIVLRVPSQHRVSDYKIRRAIQWAKEEVPAGKGGMVWVENIEVGRWALELFLAEFGADRVLYCPGGNRTDADFSVPARIEKTRTKFCIASIGANGEGKDIEWMEHMFFLQCPRSAKEMQQTVARLHRPGQMADELHVDVCLTTAFDHQLFNCMLRDAIYSHVADQPQKVIYGDYDSTPEAPFPRNYPPDFLTERGFNQVRRLDLPGEKLLESVGGAA